MRFGIRRTQAISVLSDTLTRRRFRHSLAAPFESCEVTIAVISRRLLPVVILSLLAIGVAASGSVAADGGHSEPIVDEVVTDSGLVSAVDRSSSVAMAPDKSVLPGDVVPSQPIVAAGDADPVNVTYRGDLLEEDPDAVRVTIEADVPPEHANDANLRFRLWAGATVTVIENDGFVEHLDDPNFNRLDWDGSTTGPSVTFEISDPRFEITEDWALLNVLTQIVDYRGVSMEDVDLDERVETPGAKGNYMLFLGDHTEHRFNAADDDGRLIVPNGTDVEIGEDELVESLSDSAEYLDVGGTASEVDEELFVVAKPDMFGGAAAGNNFIARPGAAHGLWFHEYVHTRQDYRVQGPVAWIVEAEAVYYQDLMMWKLTDRWNFADFQRSLSIEDMDHEDVVVSDHETYPDGVQGANYWKGALVIGALDVEIRERTDGEKSYQDVFRAMNENYAEAKADAEFTVPLFEHEDFVDAIEQVVGDPMEDFIDSYVLGSGTPAVPADPTIYSHPYLQIVDVDAPSSVTAGESETITVEVENVGDEAVDRNVRLEHDGEVLASSAVTVGAQSTTTVVLEDVEFDDDTSGIVDVLVHAEDEHHPFEITVDRVESSPPSDDESDDEAPSDDADADADDSDADADDTGADDETTEPGDRTDDESALDDEDGPIDALPGFGAIVALVAIVGASLLVGRRR